MIDSETQDRIITFLTRLYTRSLHPDSIVQGASSLLKVMNALPPAEPTPTFTGKLVAPKSNNWILLEHEAINMDAVAHVDFKRTGEIVIYFVRLAHSQLASRIIAPGNDAMTIREWFGR